MHLDTLDTERLRKLLETCAERSEAIQRRRLWLEERLRALHESRRRLAQNAGRPQDSDAG